MSVNECIVLDNNKLIYLINNKCYSIDIDHVVFNMLHNEFILDRYQLYSYASLLGSYYVLTIKTYGDNLHLQLLETDCSDINIDLYKQYGNKRLILIREIY